MTNENTTDSAASALSAGFDHDWSPGKEIAKLDARVDALRAFAQDVMAYWPEGAPDGGDLQELAEKHGLLQPETRHEPCSVTCGNACNCLGCYTPEEWDRGVTCYRKTWLLLGSNDQIEGLAATKCDRSPES